VAGFHLLVAAGRAPNSEALNHAAAGVRVDVHGFISVNERLETNVAGIYALGDVKGGPAFTHISYDDYRIIRNNLLRGGHSTTRGRLVPYTVYIDPQLGRVGPTEQEARAQGRTVRIAKIPMRWVARALEMAVRRNEGRRGCGDSADPRRGRVGGRRGRDHVDARDRDDGQAAHPALAEGLNTLFMNTEKDGSTT
jgi:pyruvate/2-oxoglutarate dehydrogenase complex dihydrolipoamide dehydrogenase (E3) component